MSGSPQLRAAMRLVDLATQQGFAFTRTVPGEDAPLRGIRQTREFIDEIVVAGFSTSCEATRRRRHSLVVPGGLPVVQCVTGDALTVLHTVTEDWRTTT